MFPLAAVFVLGGGAVADLDEVGFEGENSGVGAAGVEAEDMVRDLHEGVGGDGEEGGAVLGEDHAGGGEGETAAVEKGGDCFQAVEIDLFGHGTNVGRELVGTF